MAVGCSWWLRLGEGRGGVGGGRGERAHGPGHSPHWWLSLSRARVLSAAFSPNSISSSGGVGGVGAGAALRPPTLPGSHPRYRGRGRTPLSFLLSCRTLLAAGASCPAPCPALPCTSCPLPPALPWPCRGCRALHCLASRGWRLPPLLCILIMLCPRPSTEHQPRPSVLLPNPQPARAQGLSQNVPRPAGPQSGPQSAGSQ